MCGIRCLSVMYNNSVKSAVDRRSDRWRDMLYVTSILAKLLSRRTALKFSLKGYATAYSRSLFLSLALSRARRNFISGFRYMFYRIDPSDPKEFLLDRGFRVRSKVRNGETANGPSGMICAPHTQELQNRLVEGEEERPALLSTVALSRLSLSCLVHGI